MDKACSLGTECLSKEFKFLLELLKENGAIHQRNEWYKVFDWDHFIKLTIHHRVYPIIYLKLQELKKNQAIPAFVMQSLHQLYQQNIFQMLHLSGESEFLAKLFSENSIQTLFLKGPTLASDIYGDVSMRTSSDIDILVPIDKLDNVEQLLQSEGYVKDDYIKTVLNDWKWRHHHVSYFHSMKKIKLEIHWRLNPGPAMEPAFRLLWNNRSVSKLSRFPIYTLGKEDMFLFLVSHGARHGWSRLRWLLDIHYFVGKEMNWQQLAKLLKKYQMKQLGFQALILSSQLLHSTITQEVKQNWFNHRSWQLANATLFYMKEMVNLHQLPVPEKIAKYHKHYLFSLMSKRQKLLFLMSLCYPYPIDVETLPLPRKLHFLYFVLHPFLWVWRKFDVGSIAKGFSK